MSSTGVFLSHPADAAAYAALVEDELERRGVAPCDLEAAEAVVVLMTAGSPPPVDLVAGPPVIPVFLSTVARRDAPVALRERPSGIDAATLEPDEVAEQIAETLG